MQGFIGGGGGGGGCEYLTPTWADNPSPFTILLVNDMPTQSTLYENENKFSAGLLAALFVDEVV